MMTTPLGSLCMCIGSLMKPLMAAWPAITHGDHSNHDRVPSPRLILSHRALSLGGYRTLTLLAAAGGVFRFRFGTRSISCRFRSGRPASYPRLSPSKGERGCRADCDDLLLRASHVCEICARQCTGGNLHCLPATYGPQPATLLSPVAPHGLGHGEVVR